MKARTNGLTDVRQKILLEKLSLNTKLCVQFPKIIVLTIRSVYFFTVTSLVDLHKKRELFFVHDENRCLIFSYQVYVTSI